MRRFLLNPFFIWRAAGEVRRILAGGGPRLVRLVSVGHPEGWILPRSTVTIDVEARDGTRKRFEPQVPVPFPYAWAYRLARRLGVPLVGDLDPDRVSFQLGRSRAGGATGAGRTAGVGGG